jgi:hypothetical protein
MQKYKMLEIKVLSFAANEVFTINESLEGDVDNVLSDAWENGNIG